MAITVNTGDKSMFRENSGITDGNEIIYKLFSGYTYIIEAVNTSAGTASLKLTLDDTAPTDFTNFTIAADGTQTSNFAREVSGVSYVGLDVASGTWTTRIRRIA